MFMFRFSLLPEKNSCLTLGLNTFWVIHRLGREPWPWEFAYKKIHVKPIFLKESEAYKGLFQRFYDGCLIPEFSEFSHKFETTMQEKNGEPANRFHGSVRTGHDFLKKENSKIDKKIIKQEQLFETKLI